METYPPAHRPIDRINARQHAAEAALMEASAQGGFTYTLVRVGKLRGGGGEEGLGLEYYDKNPNPLQVKCVGKREGAACLAVRSPFSLMPCARFVHSLTHTKHRTPSQARLEEDFDAKKRGFTLSYCDNIEGETGRILAAETIVKAVRACGRTCGHGHVQCRATSLVCVMA